MRTFLLAIAVLTLSLPLPAQMIQVYGNLTADSSTNLVSNSTVCFAPVLNDGTTPLSYRLPGSGQSTTSPVCAKVNGGAFLLVLPDTTKTVPLNACFAATLTDQFQNSSLLGSGATCVQPSSDLSPTGAGYGWCSTTNQVTTCDFDKWSPSIPTLSVVNQGASINIQYAGTGSAGMVLVANYPGARLDQQIMNAQAAYPGPATFLITQSGSVGGYTLQPDHHLVFQGVQVAFLGQTQVTTDNSVDCINSTLTDSQGGTNFAYGVDKDPFFESTFEDGNFNVIGPEVQRFRVTGCRFESTTGATVFGSVGPSVDVTLERNNLHNTMLMQQQSAGTTLPGLRYRFISNNILFDPTFQQNWGAYGGGSLYGAVQDSLWSQNTLTNTCGGFELYGGGASGNPTYATILATGINHDLFEGNVFKNVYGYGAGQSGGCGATSAVFASTASSISFIGNVVDGASDIALDCEACADSAWLSNTIRNDSTAAMGTEFTSINNSFIGNDIIASNGEPGFFFLNSGGYPQIVTGITISGNSYKTTNGKTAGGGGSNLTWDNTGNTVGAFAYFNVAQQVTIMNNTVRDGVLTYSGFFGAEVIKGNSFTFDTALGACGVQMGNTNDQGHGVAIGNTVTTTVAQSAGVGAFCSGLSDPNGVEDNSFVDNIIQGPWASDFLINSGSTNLPNKVALRNNQLYSGVITPSASNGVTPVIACTNNYTATGTAAVTAGCTSHN